MLCCWRHADAYTCAATNLQEPSPTCVRVHSRARNACCLGLFILPLFRPGLIFETVVRNAQGGPSEFTAADAARYCVAYGTLLQCKSVSHIQVHYILLALLKNVDVLSSDSDSSRFDLQLTPKFALVQSVCIYARGTNLHLGYMLSTQMCRKRTMKSSVRCNMRTRACFFFSSVN